MHRRVSGSFLVRLLLVGSLMLLTNSCAKLIPLEGGPMDTIPPQLISTYPVHQTTGFKGQEIRLTFDKEVDVQDIYNKLFVSPKLPQGPHKKPSFSAKVRGETVIIALDSTLEKQTTYSFHFNDAIHDIREKTPAQDPVVTFSTGDYLDSLSLAGHVKYLMTDSPAPEALVCLYKMENVSDTVHILNSKPDYLTMTDAQGNFKLENVKAATYRVCAGVSKEKALMLDGAKDYYGFIPEPVVLDESQEGFQLSILQANVADCKVISSQPVQQYFEIEFNKPIVSYTLQLVHAYKRLKAATLYSHLLEGKKVIRVYNSLALLEDDMIEAELTAQDAMDNEVKQVVKIQFMDKVGPKKDFSMAINPLEKTKLTPPFFKADLVFSKPVKQLNPHKIACIVGGVDTVYLEAADLVFNASYDTLTITKQCNISPAAMLPSRDKTQPEHSPFVQLLLKEGAIMSVEKERNKAVSYQFFVKKEAECGTIQGNITTAAPGFTIQLLDSEGKVVDELKNQYRYCFKAVLPGRYRLRVLVLAAKDAAWKFGNINRFQPPDPVVFYPHELTIVPDWVVDDIDFNF